MQYLVKVGKADVRPVGGHESLRGRLVEIPWRAASNLADELGVKLAVVYGRREVDTARHLGADEAAAARRVGQRVAAVGCGYEAGVAALGGERAAISLHGGHLALGYDVFH